MDRSLPSYLSSHVVAMVGAFTLHTGIAAWALVPEAPEVLPQQQVINVSMISPLSEKVEEVEVADNELPPLPDTNDGMVQVKKEKEKEKKKKKPEKKKSEASLPSSGPQVKNATAENAAITKPLFDANYLQNTPPAYPPSARRSNTQGKVYLEVAVTREGTARSVEVSRSSGSNVLDEAALKAVRNWRFVPARRGSELVEAMVLVPVEFKLEK